MSEPAGFFNHVEEIPRRDYPRTSSGGRMALLDVHHRTC